MGADSEPLVLLVDDDEAIHLVARSALAGLGQLRFATGIDDSRIGLRQQPDVVLVDLDLGGERGEDVIALMQELSPLSTLFVLSGLSDVHRAVELVKAGAEDYLQKPIKPARLRERIATALLRRRIAVDAARSLIPAAREEVNPWIAKLALGVSPAAQQLVQQIRTVAPADLTVLIQGETGSGKEVVAHAIHAASSRANRPFVTVNCGALPRELIEAELFGHMAGAFTGATMARSGLIREADGGTLFLDEIGELPLELQPKLLRFLQEGEVRSVGADRTVVVDVRVIAATHQELQEAVVEKRFREDLLFRLSVLPLTVAPLRERLADIPILAEQFLRESAAKANRQLDGFDKEALRGLMNEAWPGNVRELLNRVQRATVFARGPIVTAKDLELADAPEPAEVTFPEELMTGSFSQARDQVVAAFEHAYVSRALAEADGNVAEAARNSGLPRKSLWRIAQRVGLAADRASRRAGQLESEEAAASIDPAALLHAELAGYKERSRGHVSRLVQLISDGGLTGWTEAKTIAHRLRGSGGSYGLPEVSELAGELEEAVGSLDRDRSLRLARKLAAALD